MPRSVALRPVPPVRDLAIDTVGYTRVSTEDQATERKTSLTVQRSEIAGLASRLGRTLNDAQIFEDAGASGTTAEGRPAFTALVEYCQAHVRPKRAPGFVLVLNDSRFGRFHEPEEAAYWRVTLQKCGWLVRYVENDDSSDLTTRTLMRAIGASSASEYSRQLSKNSSRGMKAAAARGIWTRRAPFGYRRQAEGPGRPPVVLGHHERKSDDQVSRLVPGPKEEVDTVRWMFDAYASGIHTLGSLARALKARMPVRDWGVTVVQTMLRNDVYLGRVSWGKRQRAGEARQVQVVHDAHAPLVSLAVFERVQQRMTENYRTRRMTEGGYPLSGLITCAICGSPYVGGGGNRGSAADPDRYRFYRDAGGSDGRRHCAGKIGTISRRFIEPAVVNAIADALEHPKVKREIERAVDEAIGQARAAAPDDRRRLELRRAELQGDLDRVVDAVARGVLPDDVARGKVETLRQELAATASQIERARFDGRAVAQLQDARASILAFAQDIRTRLTEAKGEALKELIRPWLESAVLDKENRTLTLAIRAVPAGVSVLRSFNQRAQG